MNAALEWPARILVIARPVLGRKGEPRGDFSKIGLLRLPLDVDTIDIQEAIANFLSIPPALAV